MHWGPDQLTSAGMVCCGILMFGDGNDDLKTRKDVKTHQKNQCMPVKLWVLDFDHTWVHQNCLGFSKCLDQKPPKFSRVGRATIQTVKTCENHHPAHMAPTRLTRPHTRHQLCEKRRSRFRRAWYAEATGNGSKKRDRECGCRKAKVSQNHQTTQLF